jgi:transcriptional regulator GlxA family with amidase domain
MSTPLTIVFALYPGVTHLDFTGPHQVLVHLPGARTVAASAQGGSIEAEGLTFSGLSRLADIEACDVLCVPGGFGCAEAMEDPAFMAQIRRLAGGARYVTSVCTGSLILGAAGLLTGRRAACHWAWRDLLTHFGAVPDASRVVRDGNIITGGGVTAGIDFAFTLAAEIAGPTVAQAIQLNLEYAPAPPFDSGRPETAPPAVLELVMSRRSALMERRRASVERSARALALST